MARTVTLSGTSYSVPEPGETGYDTQLTNYLVALATAFPQIGNASTQALTAEWDAGTSFGPKFQYVKSQTALPASAGFGRLARTDSIAWRNQANAADLSLSVDSANNLTFNANYVTGNPMLGASTGAGQSIANGATEVIVVFGTVELDSDASYNSGTGRYTIPSGKGGHYIIGAQIAYNTAPGGACTCSIYKNAALLKRTQAVAPGAGQSIAVAATVVLAAGDIIDIRTLQGNGAPQNLISTAQIVYIWLKRVTT